MPIRRKSRSPSRKNVEKLLKGLAMTEEQLVMTLEMKRELAKKRSSFAASSSPIHPPPPPYDSVAAYSSKRAKEVEEIQEVDDIMGRILNDPPKPKPRRDPESDPDPDPPQPHDPPHSPWWAGVASVPCDCLHVVFWILVNALVLAIMVYKMKHVDQWFSDFLYFGLFVVVLRIAQGRLAPMQYAWEASVDVWIVGIAVLVSPWVQHELLTRVFWEMRIKDLRTSSQPKNERGMMIGCDKSLYDPVDRPYHQGTHTMLDMLFYGSAIVYVATMLDAYLDGLKHGNASVRMIRHLHGSLVLHAIVWMGVVYLNELAFVQPWGVLAKGSYFGFFYPANRFCAYWRSAYGGASLSDWRQGKLFL